MKKKSTTKWKWKWMNKNVYIRTFSVKEEKNWKTIYNNKTNQYDEKKEKTIISLMNKNLTKNIAKSWKSSIECFL